MRSYRIGTVFGIPVELDLTFLLVLPLFAFFIGSDVDLVIELLNRISTVQISSNGLTGGVIPYFIGLIAAVGLFVSVLLHELGHSLVARRYGYPIDSITLWLFGGIAQFREMPENWKQELTIAIMGPIVSIVLGVGLYVVFLVIPSVTSVSPAIIAALLFVLGYLAVTNIALAIFNLLPGFPMDGGRVLRALLAIRNPYPRATQIAATVGKIFAIFLGLFGLFIQFNIFLVGIAFFIYLGATSEAQQTMMKAAFEGVVVRDIMTRRDDVDVVSADASVAELIERMFHERHTGYPVFRNGHLVGLVTLEDAKSVKDFERDAYNVDEIMSTELFTIDANAEAMDALTKLQELDVGRLIVQDSGEFVGLITRTDMMTALNIIRSSGSLGPHHPSGLSIE